MTSEPTVFIVDDDETMRDGICQLLQSVNLNIKAFASAQEFLDYYDPSTPGCLVLDVRMPGMSGPKLQEKLSIKNIHLPIIFISGHGDIPMVAKVFKRGAFDFIEKPFNSQILLDRVQDALTRDIQFRIRLADKENTRAKLALLTKREQEVMNLIVEGKLNKVIASELGLSQRTIEVHRANIMEKLGVGSVAELVTLVHKTLTNDDV